MSVTTMNELELYKKKLREEVEGMERHIKNLKYGSLIKVPRADMNMRDHFLSYNQALEDVLALIDKV